MVDPHNVFGFNYILENNDYYIDISCKNDENFTIKDLLRCSAEPNFTNRLNYSRQETPFPSDKRY